LRTSMSLPIPYDGRILKGHRPARVLVVAGIAVLVGRRRSRPLARPQGRIVPRGASGVTKGHGITRCHAELASHRRHGGRAERLPAAHDHAAAQRQLDGRMGIEHKHSTDVESTNRVHAYA
jgi:hypothetical protein